MTMYQSYIKILYFSLVSEWDGKGFFLINITIDHSLGLACSSQHESDFNLLSGVYEMNLSIFHSLGSADSSQRGADCTCNQISTLPSTPLLWCWHCLWWFRLEDKFELYPAHFETLTKWDAENSTSGTSVGQLYRLGWLIWLFTVNEHLVISWCHINRAR